MATGNRFDQVASFPDMSSCEGLEFVLKTNVEYEGYRISFGKAHPKGARFAYGFKAPLPMSKLPPVGEFGVVRIPFNRFSDKWNDATGEIEVECADDERFCPTKKWLRSPEQLSFWGEGVEGAVDLKIRSISAVGCDPSASEEAIAPSKIVSNFHSVMSNPFFLAMTLVLCSPITLAFRTFIHILRRCSFCDCSNPYSKCLTMFPCHFPSFVYSRIVDS